jgi:hypothetical protein
MLLFEKAFHAGLVSGAITLTFRRWDKPHVKAGGRYRCHPIGVIEVDRVEFVKVADIAAKDAKRAGFESREHLVEYMRSKTTGVLNDSTELWRVEMHHAGDGDRVSIAMEDKLSTDDVEAIAEKLERMDAKTAWTAETLAIIAKRPRIAASKLAAELGRETKPFKADVVKLKKLGLTQSFEVGYEISPRGRAYLAAVSKRRAKR